MNGLEKQLYDNTEPIYHEMVKHLKSIGYSFESENCLSTFHAQIGSLYEAGGIAFYGRATNGWDDDYNPGINTVTLHTRSPFFQMVRRIASTFYPTNMAEHIVWSNVCKAAPWEKGNPSNQLWEDQYKYMTKILKAELRILQPAISVFITGIEEEKRYDSPLRKKETFPDLSLLYTHENSALGIECTVECYYSKTYNQYFLVTGRPEFQSGEFRDFQANHIINAIKSVLNKS